jgi:hypothetical protein
MVSQDTERPATALTVNGPQGRVRLGGANYPPNKLQARPRQRLDLFGQRARANAVMFKARLKLFPELTLPPRADEQALASSSEQTSSTASSPPSRRTARRGDQGSADNNFSGQQISGAAISGALS